MSKPYREGRGWSIRRRVRGHAVYVSGCRSAAEARAELDRRLAALEGAGRPAGAGPARTTLAQGLQAWAMERLPFMKAAAQDADRINRYLRAGGVAVLKVSPCSGPSQAAAGTPVRRHVVTPDVLPADRPIPPGLTAHRARQANETAEAERLRAVLMRMPVAPGSVPVARISSRRPSFPQLAPVRRSATGSITAITPWLPYADHALVPICRSPIGSNMPIADTNGWRSLATYRLPGSRYFDIIDPYGVPNTPTG